MPVQRTFTLLQPVSGPARDSPAPCRPMTSKQVRDAYKASSRMPSLSRAERLRQERAEQQRIRKEFEREKAAARAKAAREKKREKGVAEREHNRKHRLPLATVRPSQDTIARFVRRGDGTVDKMNAAGQQHMVDAAAPVCLQPGEGLAGRQLGSSGRAQLTLEDYELDADTLQGLEELEAVTDGHGHRSEPAREESKPVASAHRSQNQARPATPYELDLGLCISTARNTTVQEPERCEQDGHDPSPAPAPAPRQAPPPNTQAILSDLDHFFPSSSQQERELQKEMSADARPGFAGLQPASAAGHGQTTPAIAPISPPQASPTRFSTPKRSRERQSLAIQRSRRSAALQDLHHKERPRAAAAGTHPRQKHQAPRHAQQQHEPTTGRGRQLQNVRPARQPNKAHPAETSVTPPESNKENAAAQAESLGDPNVSSQETEYGGEWVDEIAIELTI